MTTPIPDEVLKAWDTDGLTIKVDANTVGNLARDRANLARELLQAREALREIVYGNHLPECQEDPGIMDYCECNQNRARACLPEYQK